MKKQLLLLSVVGVVTTGCAQLEAPSLTSQDYIVLPAADTQAVSEAYSPSDILAIEAVRSGINKAFIAAQPVYKQLTNYLNEEPVLQQAFATLSTAESSEERQSVVAKLTQENQSVLNTLFQSQEGQQLMGSLAETATLAINNISLFQDLDTQSLLTDVGVLEVINEKQKLAQTMDQISYLNSTVIAAYSSYQDIAGSGN